MFSIQVLNKISKKGLDILPSDTFKISTECENPEGILVRSASLHDTIFPQSLLAIARAGAGVNNIPLDRCSEMGIVVFNTPGANANAVKELVVASLLLSSRKINQGINWVQTLKGKGDEVTKLVEKGKAAFEGPEIKGKRLGVIGLGAIGVMVANDASALGMEVLGYDPYLSINSAWALSRDVARASAVEEIYSSCDYITIHVPLDDSTRSMVNREKFEIMKRGVRIINLSRGGLIDNKDMLEAIDKGTVACYVTDFPEDVILGNDNIIIIPHLGASTKESEENCALMAAKQLKDYLEYGTIKNSVNFPECDMPYKGHKRLVTAHLNIPGMVGRITSVLSEKGVNISGMVNQIRDKVGYNIIDFEGDFNEKDIDEIRQIEGVKVVRLI